MYEEKKKKKKKKWLESDTEGVTFHLSHLQVNWRRFQIPRIILVITIRHSTLKQNEAALSDWLRLSFHCLLGFYHSRAINISLNTEGSFASG